MRSKDGALAWLRKQLRALREHRTRLLLLTLASGFVLLLWPGSQARSDNFVFYLPNAHEVVELEQVENAQYLPLIKVLNLVGTVSGLEERRNSLKVWIGKTQLELHQDDRKVRVDKAGLKLANPVRFSNGQWIVPLDFLYSVLPRLTNQPLTYRVGDKRMFIGDVRPETFSLRLDPIANGARLTVQFSGSVEVRSAATNGKWVLFLGNRPLTPLEPAFRFENRYVSEVQFDDQDGVPKLIISPTSSGLNFYSTVADQGKVLQADVVQPAAVSQQAQTAQQPVPVGGTANPPGPAPPPPPSAAPAPAAPPAPVLPAVVLDAGHGGPDAGARSRDGVLEKDLVAQLADRVRAAVAATKQYRVIMTRSGDSDPTFEERSATANVARPVAFITLHAGDLGGQSPRVVVYSYQPTDASRPSAETSRIFIPWALAQEASLDRSRQLAGALQQQLARVPGLATSNPDQAPERQLRSIDAPAVAIEIGSLSPSMDAGPLTSPGFQEQIANAVAQAIATFRGGTS